MQGRLDPIIEAATAHFQTEKLKREGDDDMNGAIGVGKNDHPKGSGSGDKAS
jgi:hypothetical protein